MIKVLLLLLFTTTPIKQVEPDELQWYQGKKLSWQNFKGKPEVNNPHSAVTDCYINLDYHSLKDTLFVCVKTIFIQSESWVKKEDKQIALLKHEQIHFDIAELYARKLRQTILKLKIKKTSAAKEVKLIKENIKLTLIENQNLYDKETNHSRNTKKQLEWEKKITKELQLMDAFKSTEIKIFLVK